MTNQPEIKPCADAVEALAKSIAHTEWEYASPNPTSVIEHLATQGYTITRAEPAAPSSDEVDRAFSTLERYDTFHQHHTGYDSSAEIKTIRDHIAALEEGIEALSSANESFAKRIANLATENKRLREVLTKYATADVTCSYVEVSSRAYEVHEHCEKWAQAAIAQTD